MTTCDQYWQEWDVLWHEESAKVFKTITAIKTQIASLPLPEEEKKALTGKVNDVGRWILKYGEVAGEQNLRELNYTYAIQRMNDERKIFKEIVTDLLKKIV